MRIILFFISTLLSFPTAHALPSDWTFQTLRTSHFDIIYRSEQKHLAKVYARASEQAYQLLIPIFKEAPERTVVVLRDDTDSANGMATFLPYPLIILNPVLPMVNESISDFSDWALELMVHEYTHILNMHPVHGAIRPLGYLFGSVIKPNGILPRWYMEGLAVNTESRLTNSGRLRSPEQAASVRAAVEGKSFPQESIDRINDSSIPTWPLGSRPYLYGSLWWNEAYTVNPEAVYNLNQDYSRRFPFLINGPMTTHLKTDASGHLNRTYSRLEQMANIQFTAIEAAGGEKSEALKGDDAADLTLPTLSSDQLSLVYLTREVGTAASLKVVRRSATKDSFQLSKAQTIGRSVGTSRISFMPDGQSVVFDQIVITHPHVSFRDLYLQPAHGSAERLTFGMRASEPFATADGKHILFIQSEGGQTSLAVLDLDSRQTRTLFKAPLQDRLAQPTVWNGQVYALWRSVDGKDRLMIISLEGGSPSFADVSLQKLAFLTSTPKSLLIGSGQTGATNVYSWDEKAPPHALTNTKTALNSAAWDEGRSELIISRLTSSGNRLHTTPATPTHPPQLSSFFELPDAPPTPEISEAPQELSYQPWRYMTPRYWIPFIAPVENGMLFQGQTYNVDPIGRNEYSLLGSYDTVTRKGGFGINYANSSTPATLGLAYSKFQNYLGASQLELENQNAEISTSFFLSPRSKYWRGQVSGAWAQTIGSQILRRMGPGAGVLYSHLEDAFSNRGWAFSVHHREYLSQGQNLHYGLSSAAFEFRTGTGASNSRHLVINLKGAFAPRLPFNQVINLGERNLGANYLVNLSGSDYLLRGYPSGTFIGRKILNANLEYQMPLKSYWSGWGTLPLFLKNLEGVVFFDSLAVDGRAFHADLNPAVQGYYRTDLKEFYSGTGMELRLNTTAAYHLPLTFTLGLYYGLKNEYSGGFTPFLGISYEGLGSIGL